METSDDSDLQQFTKSPPRRRRSTFFVRRESLATEPLIRNDNELLKNSDNGDENQHLLRYYDSLQKEKQQWKEEVKHWRNDYRDLRELCKIAKNGACRAQCYSELTNEDIDFLNKGLNLSKLIESHQALHKTVKFTQALYRKAVELDNVVLKSCEENVNRINNYILDNSTLEQIEH